MPEVSRTFFIGLLASVGNLGASFINGSYVLLSWIPPYTLDNVPIIGYDIDDDSDRLLNTTNSSYILSSTDANNPEVCNITNVLVYPVNGAGIGQPNNISFYYKRG